MEDVGSSFLHSCCGNYTYALIRPRRDCDTEPRTRTRTRRYADSPHAVASEYLDGRLLRSRFWTEAETVGTTAQPPAKH
jgi:hypothetical protein